jgi:hypothetical protein
MNQIKFIDNTDPAGIDHQIAQLGPELATTLVIVISKVPKFHNFPYISISSQLYYVFICLTCLLIKL